MTRPRQPAARIALVLAAAAAATSAACGDGGPEARRPEPAPSDASAPGARGDGASPAAPPTPEYRNWSQRRPPVHGVALVARDPVTGDVGALFLSDVPGSGAHAAAAKGGVAVATLGSVAPRQAVRLAAALADAPEPSAAEEPGSVWAFVRHDGARGLATSGRAPTPAVGRFLPEDAADGLAVLASGCPDLDEKALEAAAARFAARGDLPLPERLIVAARPLAPAVPIPMAGALVVERVRDGRSVLRADLRCDLNAEPLDRLAQVLPAVYEAEVGPALKRLQVGKPRDDPSFAPNLEWLARIRDRVDVGEPR